ncbi:MAG: hypothetical protein AAF533_21445 [Acidobacteriota bacterium]
MSLSTPSSSRLVSLGLVACLALAGGTVPAGAQDEKSRKKKAREEQAERRKAEKAERRAADAEATEKLEADLSGATPLIESKRGFFIGVQATSAEVSGADRTIARVGDIVVSDPLDSDGNGLPDAFSIANERDIRLEQSSKLSGRFELGWRRGNGGSISIRHWGFSQGDDVDVSSRFEQRGAGGEIELLLGGIDNPGFENGIAEAGDRPSEQYQRPFGSPILPRGTQSHGAERVVGNSSFSIRRTDLLYRHAALLRPRVELHYTAGLTVASVKRSDSATFTWRSFPSALIAQEALNVEQVSATSDSSAFGLTVGAATRIGLDADRKWAFRAGVELSGLRNDADLSYRNQVTSDQISFPEPVVNPPFQETRNNPASHLLTIVDLDLGIEGQVSDRVRLSLGYRHSRWNEALVEQSFQGAENRAQLVEAEKGITLKQPYFGVTFSF